MERICRVLTMNVLMTAYPPAPYNLPTPTQGPPPPTPPPPTYAPAAPTYALPTKPKVNWLWTAVIAIIVGLVCIVATYGAMTATTTTTTTTTLTLLSQGNIYTVSPMHFYTLPASGSFDLTGASSWTVYGQFTATGNGVIAYFLTSAEYQAWGQTTTPPAAWEWSAGYPGNQVVSATINPSHEASGYYYLVFINEDTSVSTNVMFTTDLTATS